MSQCQGEACIDQWFAPDGRHDPYSSIDDALECLQGPEHLCHVYETEQDRVAVAASFLALGLERREQCACVGSESSAQAILAKLADRGVDIGSALESEALQLLSIHETYLAGGRFEPGRMIGLLAEAAHQARRAGFARLRITGDPGPALLGNETRFIEYEAALNKFLPANDILALCQYDRRRVRPSILRDAIRTHPLVVWRSEVCRNECCLPPEELLDCDGAVAEVDRLLAHLRERTRNERLALLAMQVAVQERKLAEAKARQNQRLLTSMVNATMDPACLMDAQGAILACNAGLADELGSPASDLVGACMYDRLPAEVAMVRKKHLDNVLATGQTTRFEDECRGRIFEHCVYPVPADDEQQAHLLAIVSRDVTERRRMEREREVAAAILSMLNTAGSLRELIAGATRYLADWTGCSAVGVRLRDGNDYPYYETLGLSADFVACESRLCRVDPEEESEAGSDDVGNPVLECMCGNVIRGRVDPSKPFFTPHGSFWTNSTTKLLAETSEQDRQARTRNRCNGEGYESVALIPIRTGTTTLGLMQFNSQQAGRFTPDIIATLERVAAHLAIGLANRMMTDDLLASRQNLLESERRLRALLDNIPDPMWLKDTDGRYLAVNQAWTQFRGISPQDAIGKSNHAFMDAKQADALREEDGVVVRSQVQIRQQHHVADAQGRLHVLDCIKSPIIDHDGSSVGLVGIARDITEQRRAEERLRAVQEHQSAIIAASPLAIVTYDVNGIVQGWNAAAERTFGWAEPEVLGKPVPYFPEEQAAAFAELRRNVLEGGFTSPIEVTRKRKDGSLILVNVSLAPIHDKDGAAIGIVSVLEDISERRRQEERRKRMESQLQQVQKLNALGQMAAGLAHDFNNMLTIMRLSAESARDLLDDAHPAQGSLRIVEDTANQAAEITRSLLTFGQLAPAERKVHQACDLVRDALALLRHALPSRIRLIEEISCDCPCDILVDRTQLHQVLINLAINARDAMPRGGTLTVSVSCGAPPGNGVLREGSRNAIISMTDTGTGIAPALIDRIFDPFFTTKRPGEGTGLGLSLVHGIVADHGGTIEVESEVDKGTRFTITLPLIEDAEPAEAVVPAGAQGHGERLLIAMDDVFQSGAAAGYLRSTGYRVLVANTVSDMLDQIEQHRDDLKLVVAGGSILDHDAGAWVDRARELSPDLRILTLTGGRRMPGETFSKKTTVVRQPLALGEIARVIGQLAYPEQSRHG